MSSEEDYDDLVYDDDEDFGQDEMEPGEFSLSADWHEIGLIVESESEPDAYDVLSPGIEGELSVRGGLLMRRIAKEEAIRR